MPSFRGGGAERAMVTLANDLLNYNISITIIVASDEGVYRNELSDKVNVISLDVRKVSHGVFRLARALSKIQPDAILSTLFNANCVALVAYRLAGRPGNLVLREASVFLYNQDYKTKVSHFIMSFLYRKSSAIIAVSRAVKNELLEVMKIKNNIIIEIIPNSIGTDDIDELANRELEPYIAELEGKAFILGVGRLDKSKGFDDLIHAVAELKNRPELNLVLLGEGALRQQLVELAAELGIRDRVFLPGFTLNPYAWMKQCSVFVLSSYYEGSPNVLIQALGVGAPVVSTQINGVTDDLLNNGEFGKLVPLGDPKSMARAIDESLNNPLQLNLDKWRGLHSKKTVTEKYFKFIFGNEFRNSSDNRNL